MNQFNLANTSRPSLPDNHITIAQGSNSDYQQLAHFHYRGNRPATCTTVYKAILHRPTPADRFRRLHQIGSDSNSNHNEQIIGILMRSLPHLGCAMRSFALNDRYRGLDPATKAKLLNEEFRTISRVIIDPRFPGIGLARRLVEHALAHPESPYTESLAAMGAMNPFFERAGMMRYDPPAHPDDERLQQAIAVVGLKPQAFASTQFVANHCRTQLGNSTRAWFFSELRHWQRRRGNSHKRKAKSIHDCEPLSIIQSVRERLIFRPIYFLSHHNNAMHDNLE